MPLDVTVVDGMPRLAWIVSLGRTPRAVVGSGVDILAGDGCTRVTEGAWDGDFAASDILQTRHMFGSGLVADADGIVFCAASHTVEALYAFAGGGRILVSNSLAFLIRCSGVALDPRQPIYRRAHSLMRGLSAYDRLIYEHGGDRIYRYAYCNFTFRDGQFETTDKPVPPPFPTFETYKEYMLDVLRAVRDNAASPGRKRSYRLLTSVSSGYDSAVCAALGAAVGCHRAVTLATGRNNASDSGMPVAEALGMPCMARERVVAPADGERFVEADFFASFESGDTMFTAFSDALPGSLFLIGHYGLFHLLCCQLC
jgi:hypothetical protein